MKLTSVLLKCQPTFIGPIIRTKGSAFKGKDKFVEPATKSVRYRLWKEWLDQERVMKYTSVPYVTADEEIQYLASIGEKHQDVDPLYTSVIEEPMRQRYATDILQYFERNRQHEIWE